MNLIHKLFLSIGLMAMLPAMSMMVVRDQHGYAVHDGNKISRNIWGMDKSLTRYESKMTPEIYKKFVEVGGKIKPSRLSDGSYYLHDKSGIKGGGPWLAFIVCPATMLVGTVATAGAAIGAGFATGGAAIVPTIIAGVHATVAATVYATEAALIAPTP